jgi:hypothetical protein
MSSTSCHLGRCRTRSGTWQAARRVVSPGGGPAASPRRDGHEVVQRLVVDLAEALRHRLDRCTPPSSINPRS